MKPFFLSIFEYNCHYNERLGKAFRQHAHELPERSVHLFNHILNAQHVWNNRIQPEEEAAGIWQLHQPEEWQPLNAKNYEASVRIINERSFDTVIYYTNSKGESLSNVLGDILYHIVNHATYHRGQIAVAFRKAGLEPLITDYIFYKR